MIILGEAELRVGFFVEQRNLAVFSKQPKVKVVLLVQCRFQVFQQLRVGAQRSANHHLHACFLSLVSGRVVDEVESEGVVVTDGVVIVGSWG